MTLNELKCGESATIEAINLKCCDRRRLLDMGVSQGVAVKMIRAAPLGDPLQIKLRGYCITLRKATAKQIKIIKEKQWVIKKKFWTSSVI